MINEYFGISKTKIFIIFSFFFQNGYPFLAIESVTGFGEIQHNLILKWKKKKIVSMNLKKKEDISHYLYPCYISLKNKDMFPGKKKS